MTSPSKPRLTARVIRGLSAIHALADVNQIDESDLYAGCYKDPRPTAEGADLYDRRKCAEVDDAVDWIADLIHWYGQTHPNAKTD